MSRPKNSITKVVQLYIDGAGGDVSKLRDAFHPDARMYGHIGPMQHAIPITGFFDMVAEQPWDGIYVGSLDGSPGRTYGSTCWMKWNRCWASSARR